MDKELEKNRKESRLEKSREDKLLAFIGGKFIIYILLIVILLGIAIYLYTEISYNSSVLLLFILKVLDVSENQASKVIEAKEIMTLLP